MAVLAIILLNGTTADANQVMSDFYPLYQDMAPVNVAAGNKTGTGRFVLDTGPTITNPILVGPTFSGSVPQLTPIGSIIPFYDFNALVTFNTTYWKYCNGTAIVNASSPLNGQTAPDLSGRALVGFGTDGGGDIGTAAWATAAVGNAGNTINLAHAHTVAGHTHSISGLTYSGTTAGATTGTGTSGGFTLTIAEMPSHTHDVLCYTAPGATPAQVTGELISNSASFSATGAALATGGGGSHSHSVPSLSVPGLTYSGTTAGATSGSTSPATDSQLSATQSIQPISIRVRFIMRVL